MLVHYVPIHYVWNVCVMRANEPMEIAKHNGKMPTKNTVYPPYHISNSLNSPIPPFLPQATCVQLFPFSLTHPLSRSACIHPACVCVCWLCASLMSSATKSCNFVGNTKPSWGSRNRRKATNEKKRTNCTREHFKSCLKARNHLKVLYVFSQFPTNDTKTR